MNLLKATFFILLLTNIFSCKQCNKEIKFSKNHTDFIPNYSEGQTIIYFGENSERDTIIITTVRDTFFCGTSFISPSKRNFSLKIENLPKEKWSRVNNSSEELFSIGSHSESSKKSNGRIQFRDFVAEIPLENIKLDTTLLDFPDAKDIWHLKTEQNNSNLITTTETVIEVIWTKKYGLTKFLKLNNGWYSKINNQNQ